MMRANQGRQRIEIKKIQSDSRRQVTFSKRRSGLFKKASELCTLIGSEIMVIVNSLGSKMYSFDHPYVKEVIDRYENQTIDLANNSNSKQLVEVIEKIKIQKLITELNAVNEELQREKTKGTILNQREKISQAQHGTHEKSIRDMDDKELTIFKSALRELRGRVAQQSELLQQKQVEKMRQSASMVQHPELMKQNTTFMQQNSATGVIGGFMDSRQPSIATTRLFYRGISLSNNAMNLYDPMTSSSSFSTPPLPLPLPPHVGPWNLNLEKI